jgi:hypothetical protein
MGQSFCGQKSKIAETLDDAEAEDIPYPDEKKMTVSTASFMCQSCRLDPV